jgi:hypothetical protein
MSSRAQKLSPKLSLTALGLLTVLGVALAGLAHAASQPSASATSELELLGGPKGPPVAKPKPAPKPAPLTAPSLRAPLAPGVESQRVATTEAAPVRVGKTPVIEEEEPAPPVVAAYRNHGTPDDHEEREMVEVPQPEPDTHVYADRAPRGDDPVIEDREPQRAEAPPVDERVDDSDLFARLENSIARNAERGALGQRQAMMLYAELDDIAAQRDYYQRTRGMGPQEREIVDRRLDVLEQRISRVAAPPVPYQAPYRGRYRY